MKKLMDMSPYELGESGREEAIKYLIMYLTKGKANDKRLAASAIGKLALRYKESCNKAIPFLIENLSDSHGQVRQYTLKALTKLTVPKKYYSLIKNVAENDSAEYCQRAALQLLEQMALEYSKKNVNKTIAPAKSHKDNHKTVDYKAQENRFLDILSYNCGIRLTEKQKAAVLHKDGPAIVLAVPGAGKTTVLLARTANLIINHKVNPASILSITFSRASALDMRNRYYNFFSKITSIGANFSTIHSFCYELIRKYSIMNKISYKIIEEGGSKRDILRELFREYNGENIDDDALEDLINSIGYVKNMMLKEDELEEFSHSVDIKYFTEIYNDYEKIKKSNNYIDYDDMLTLAYDILQEDEELLQRYRSIYEYIQIDEGQDTSKIQHKLIELIANPKNNVFIVADDDQSIYSFRGAYPKFLLEFDSMYKDTKKYFIDQNFRSTPEIVALANRFIKSNSVRFNKEMKTANPSGPRVNLVKVKDELQEVDYIIKELASATNKESAILYRNNMSAIKLADELSRRGVSFYIRDYNKFFFKHFILQDIRSFIMFTLDNRDIEAFSRIYYRINSFISKETFQLLSSKDKGDKDLFDLAESLVDLSSNQRGAMARLRKIFAFLKLKSPVDFIDYVEKDLGYTKYLKDNCANIGYSYESLKVILSNLKSLAVRCSSFAAFLVRLEELEKVLEESKLKKGKSYLTLSTMHSSKGLEFENVFLIDLIENIMPTRSSIESYEQGEIEELEEERRLMYVALTRAKQRLHLIVMESKNEEKVKPSRFVEEILNFMGRMD
ncbi:putative ATP-dependent DNA helicase YjcD [Clostridium sp. N3C]|uniref:UvrD-helicase domain-containing protein n=1 Tax=Clostridium sp. N3C TaxID=1776758 RepID=UPI00092E111C|nr:UvrD-helicase domain-containing protein [Clostridium sp. N3C]SCN25186.1 putative ATP-dependent DNA helicase YjcD [Clostridium sp. N3C]